MFYWKIRFEDGTILAQFDDEGNEYDLKSSIPEHCWYTQEGRTCIDFTKNIFEKLEKIHGRIVEASWNPFTDELLAKAKAKQPQLAVQLLKNAVSYKKAIPTGFFPYIHRTVAIEVAATISGHGTPARGYTASLFLGYLPRPGIESQGQIDRINLTGV
jgi:hypothetical protein